MSISFRYCMEPNSKKYPNLEGLVDFIAHSFRNRYCFLAFVPPEIHKSTRNDWIIMADDALSADDIKKACDLWFSNDHDLDAEWEEIVR